MKISLGVRAIENCVADTGPLLHLSEIGRLETITIFECILISSHIAHELREYGVATKELQSRGLLSVRRVLHKEAERAQKRLPQFRIGLEDASCLILAEKTGSRIVLTDDLELRKAVKAEGRKPVGSIGVIVKNFVIGRFSEIEFRDTVDMLLDESTLFVSAAFRKYVISKVEDTIRTRG